MKTDNFNYSEKELNGKNNGGNTGSKNVGHYNSGNRNKGTYNSGDYNNGHGNSGSGNNGDRNVGKMNQGDGNTGNNNVGLCNSGHFNLGRFNTGRWNAGDYNNGVFNTNNDTMMAFNKPCSYQLLYNAYKPQFLFFSLNCWVDEYNMTEEEKKADPHYAIRGGTLRTLSYKEAFKKSWDEADPADRIKIKDFPNFDPEVFYEISGIDLREKERNQ